MNEQDLVTIIFGGIWGTPGVSHEPEIVMVRWRVVEIVGGEKEGQRHLIGYNVAAFEGRVSTAVVAFDREKMEATTKSGRVYRLEGRPGFDDDGDYVWLVWAPANGIESVRDVSSDYLPLES